jgi:hypothetical protein
MLINRSAYPSLLRPGLARVFGDWNTWRPLWKDVYKSFTSDKAAEYEVEMQGLGVAQQKAEGTQSAQGYMQQGYITQFIHQYYSLAFAVTRAAITDNLYQAQFPQQSLQLRNAFETTDNINAMYIFNNAFNANSTVSDGQPLCSTAHPIYTGTLSNTFINGVGFTESAVEEAISIIRSWYNLAGLQINTQSVKVLVPQKQAFNAARIFKSQYQTGTGNNDINALVHDKYMPGGYIVNQFLMNPNNWFILTDNDGFRYYMREPLDIDFFTDDGTDNVIVRGIKRDSWGCSNWRAVFGSFGS